MIELASDLMCFVNLILFLVLAVLGSSKVKASTWIFALFFLMTQALELILNSANSGGMEVSAFILDYTTATFNMSLMVVVVLSGMDVGSQGRNQS